MDLFYCMTWAFSSSKRGHNGNGVSICLNLPILGWKFSTFKIIIFQEFVAALWTCIFHSLREKSAEMRLLWSRKWAEIYLGGGWKFIANTSEPFQLPLSLAHLNHHSAPDVPKYNILRGPLFSSAKLHVLLFMPWQIVRKTSVFLEWYNSARNNFLTQSFPSFY